MSSVLKSMTTILNFSKIRRRTKSLRRMNVSRIAVTPSPKILMSNLIAIKAMISQITEKRRPNCQC